MDTRLFLLLGLLWCAGCANDIGPKPAIWQVSGGKAVRRIEDGRISYSDLLKEIGELRERPEPPSFWRDIAERPEISLQHRRICVWQLLKRHVSAGMRLKDVGAMLRPATWLKDKDVCKPGVIAGRVPLQPYPPSDAIIFLFVLPEERSPGRITVFLRLCGTDASLSEESLARTLRGEPASPAVGNLVISEIAVPVAAEDARGYPEMPQYLVTYVAPPPG